MASVEYKDHPDSVELTFIPPISINEFTSMPLPDNRHNAAFNLEHFPEYGNKGLRISNEVFTIDKPEDYALRLANFLGRTLVNSEIET
jgi:hypothetical protein